MKVKQGRVKGLGTLGLFVLILLTLGLSMSYGWQQQKPVKEDPLVRMPGTQPFPENAADIESPTRCTNCHGGYNQTVEPAFNWQGSMMAQSARDFLFYACMTTAAQDAIWAVGDANATDICIRCHFPKGWMEGRSDQTNASLMTGNDFDGVQCDLCHSMVDPFFETTYAGTREGNDWLGYWDETNASATPSNVAAEATYLEDLRLSNTIQTFAGLGFFTNNLPPVGYTENTSGQMFLDDVRDKRASFADASARHAMLYSRYHKSKYFCASCHDVSNPILANAKIPGLPGPADDGSGKLITEQHSAHKYFHVERTFSEFMLSDYGLQGGAPTNPEFQAQGAPDITHAAKCQDCHMRDGVGQGAGQRDAVVRPTESVEHPQSGQPIHDLTGGNAWVSTVLASAVTGSPNYDATNDALLNQGPAVLTLDLNQGLGIDPVALLAGADRAMQQLQLAATIKNLTYDAGTGALSFRVQNNSGHKLISGFPEGRRMFINIKAEYADGTTYEINPYDTNAATLKGLEDPQVDILYGYTGSGALPAPAPLTPNELYVDELVYEMKPTSSLTGEEKTFHFALATGRYKDNRIPPKGFRIADAAERISVPVSHGTDDPGLYSSAEYAGGYDEVSLTLPAAADYVEVGLYYQTTSREYIEFLRDEINGYSQTSNAKTLPGTGAGGDAPYLIQNDPSGTGFFNQLKAWGDTIWQLWLHNRNVTTAAPFQMAVASVGTSGGGGGCNVVAPVLNNAIPGNSEVVLDWSPATGATGYNVYYDQAGKSAFIADAGNALTYPDTGLTNGTEYCYKVTSYTDATCESGFSNVICATPTNQGQSTMDASVQNLVTGVWTGKGGNQSFNLTSSFTAGDTVTFQAYVYDVVGGTPIQGATYDLLITGPESAVVTSGSTDATGLAEAAWNTKAAKGKSAGTIPGTYTATVKGVAANGYAWDGVEISTTFNIQ